MVVNPDKFLAIILDKRKSDCTNEVSLTIMSNLNLSHL